MAVTDVRKRTILIGACAIYMALYLRALIGHGAPYVFGDFFALWSYPRIAMTRAVATLYDPAQLREGQIALGLTPPWETWFPYPPTALLPLWPIGLLPYQAAFVAWIALSLGAYLISIGGLTRSLAVLALLAPASTVAIAAGQSGFLLAALLIGGLRSLARRPLLAGCLFGLLTCKPQFGLLLPVALLAAGQWRCVGAAAGMTAVLALVATLAFGPDAWAAWLHAMPNYAAWFAAGSVADRLMPTVLADLQSLGVPDGIAWLAQGTVSLLSALLTGWVVRRRPADLAIPAIAVATCLAMPHAFIYDLPMVAAAVALLIAARTRRGLGFTMPEAAVLLLALIFPAIMAASAYHLPIGPAAMILLLAVIVRPKPSEMHS